MGLSASSVHTVPVPLEPPLLGGARPPVAVELPLTCHPRRGLMAAYAVFMLALAALGLLLFLSALSLLTEGTWPLAIAMLGLATFAAGWFGGTGLALGLDALRPGPALVVGADGLEDRRQGVRLRWDEVTQAEIRASRVGIASLAMATRGAALRSPPSFRVGAHRRRTDELVVPLQFLSPPPHVSGLVITALIERAGGNVQGKPFWAHG